MSQSDTSDETVEDNHASPPSYIIIKFSKKAKPETIRWIVDKIRNQRSDGGGELIVRQQPLYPNEGITLHISASPIKFLEVAEEMDFVKKDRNGQIREFIVSQLEDFLGDGMHIDDLLTVAERQTIVKHELENIRALADDKCIAGYDYHLYEGQSIVQVCERKKIISQVYPLHDRDALKKLSGSWYKRLWGKQPIEEIRLYFGEAVALYFAFLGFYTTALIVPLVLGLIQLFVSKETLPFFCAFNVVWVTVFLELWKRRSNELAFSWGTIGMTSLDEPRANYHGHMGTDPVTGRIQPQYPRWKTNVKMYCASFPIVAVCMFGAFLVMLGFFWFEDFIKSLDEEYRNQLWALPSIVYAILVSIISHVYRKFATALTEWENHRTQSQFERHRVLKLVLFESVNNFMSFFYIAFIIQDIHMLRTQLAIMLIIQQTINNLQATVLPLILRNYIEMMSRMKTKLFNKDPEKKPLLNSSTKKTNPIATLLDDVPVISEHDAQIIEAKKEGAMETYEGTYDDYLEMFVQFGFVVLFSSVYPIAACLAVLNNIIEIRADAFKLCVVVQRPMTRKVKDIGVWQNAFQMIGMLSVMTNCGLLWLSPGMRARAPDVSPDTWVLLFVLLEHVLLAIRYMLNKGIADKPMWVRVQLAKRNFLSKQALKNERAQKSRKLLTRRFKTVHHRPMTS